MDVIWNRYVEPVLSVITMLALVALVALPAVQVVLRSGFDHPIIGLEEATRWSLIIIVFLGTPLLIATNQHIRLAEFVDLMPQKPRRLLERAILLASGATFCVIAASGVLSVLRNVGTRTPTLDIPFWLFASPILVGFGIAAIGYLWYALRRAPPPGGGQSII